MPMFMEISCSVCQKKTELTDNNLGLHHCGFCNHIFRNPHKDECERYSEEYFLKEHKNWFENPNYGLFESIYKIIIKLNGTGRLKVLDVGCGRGDLLKYLRNRDPQLELYGIDLVLNEYPGIKFFKGNILEEQDFGVKFDIIINLAVIEHVEAPHLFCEKLYDFLVPGGIVFTVTVNTDGLIYDIAGILKNIGIKSAYNRLFAKHHLQFFSGKSLKMLMSGSGFDIIAQKNHAYPIKAVDCPKENFLITKLYLAAIYIIFSLSAVLNKGLLQTIVCKKK